VDPDHFAFDLASWNAGNRTYLEGRFTITAIVQVPTHLFPETFDFTSTVPVEWIRVKGHEDVSIRTWNFSPSVTSGTGIGPNPDPDGFRRVKDVWVCFDEQ
jgi:hypothetical protein